MSSVIVHCIEVEEHGAWVGSGFSCGDTVLIERFIWQEVVLSIREQRERWRFVTLTYGQYRSEGQSLEQVAAITTVYQRRWRWTTTHRATIRSWKWPRWLTYILYMAAQHITSEAWDLSFRLRHMLYIPTTWNERAIRTATQSRTQWNLSPTNSALCLQSFRV